MKYVFIVNGRFKDGILPGLQEQIDREDIDYEIHVTKGKGEATLFVNIYCDLNPADEVCFVACGGSGTVNEVVSALVLKPLKHLAILEYDKCTNDFLKCFPDREFTSVRGILEGEARMIDAIRANDNYALNTVNVGFDAAVAKYANRYETDGYRKGVLRALLSDRHNRIRLVADGETMIRRSMLLATMANGRYCGGKYLCAPNADLSDGLMDVCAFKPMSLPVFAAIIGKYEKGLHLTDKFCLRHLKYRRAQKVTLSSKDLITLALDGEITASTSFEISIIHDGVSLILPPAR